MSIIVNTNTKDDSIFSQLYPYSAGIGKASILTIKPDLYNCIATTGIIPCDRFDHNITSVGRSSFKTVMTLREKCTGVKFIKYEDRVMLFDYKRKEIIQLEKMKTELKLKGINVTGSGIIIETTLPTLPVFTATREVRAEQVDHNNHLAAPWYAVMAVDVVAEANSRDFFKQPHYDFTSTGMRVIHLEQVHQGEALLGDELLFTVWWEIDVIKIQVTKHTSTSIAYLVIGLDKNTKSNI